MGSVFKKGDFWAIRYDLPESTREKRKRKQLTGFLTEKDAKDHLTLMEAEMIKGTYFNHTKITLNELLDIWMRDHVRATLALKTYEYYDNQVRVYLKPYIGHLKISDIKVNHITAFYAKLAKDNVSKGTTAKCHETLRAALNKAYEWEYTNSKIMDRVKPPKVEKNEQSFWDEKMIEKGLKYFKDSNVLFHMIVSINLGMRQGEICGLRETQINYKTKVLTVNRAVQKIKGEVFTKEPKNEPSKRKIPLTDDMVDVFKKRSKWIMENKIKYGEKYNHSWDGYFSVNEFGDIMPDTYISSTFKNTRNRLMKIYPDLEYVTFHDLRHSCASWLLSKGVDMKTIQEILGHSSMSTTADIYAHVNVDKKREALEKLHF